MLRHRQWVVYLGEVWGMTTPSITSPSSVIGIAAIVAFLLAGLFWLIARFLPWDIQESVSAIISLSSLVAGMWIFGVSAPYRLWKRDAPLRDLAATQKKTPGRFVWAYLSPVESQENGGKALVRVSLVNALLFPLHLQQVKGVLVSDKGRIAEFVLLDVPEILHAGVSVSKLKVITLSEVTKGFPLNLPALDLVVDSQEGMVQIRGIYQSSPKNGE